MARPISVAFDGRRYNVSRNNFFGFKKLAKNTGLGSSFIGITGYLNASGNHPVNIRIGRNNYSSDNQYRQFMANLVVRPELRVPSRIRFMSDILSFVTTSYLTLYDNRRLINNVNLGLTGAFCRRNSISDQVMNDFGRISAPVFDLGLINLKLAFLQDHNLITFYELSATEMNATFNHDINGQIFFPGKWDQLSPND